LAEAKKHRAWKLLRGIPSIGSIRTALIMVILQTPHVTVNVLHLFDPGQASRSISQIAYDRKPPDQ
jgi:hypothetical protein